MRVERDESGRITRVLHPETKPNPLGDPLNELEEEEDDNAMEGVEDNETEEVNPVVRQLQEQASRVAEKKPRKQSAREKEWCQRLAEKWGTDYKGMMRDRKLNPMQQTEADIKKRVEKWRASESEAN